MEPYDRVYTPSRRFASFLLLIVAVLASFTGSLLLWVIFIQRTLPEERSPSIAQIPALLIGLLLALFASMTVASYCTRLVYRGLREAVARKVRSQGVDLPLERTDFYGISPGEAYRMYGGDTDWDVGFLWLEGDRLLYVGDRIRFALTAVQIDKIAFQPSPGEAIFDSLRLLLYWKDSQTGIGGVLAISPREAFSSREVRRRLEDLKERIENWKADCEERSAAAPVFPIRLGLPPPFVHEGYDLYQHNFSKGGWMRSGIVMLALLILLMAVHWSSEYLFGRSFLESVNKLVVLIFMLILGNFLAESWDERLRRRGDPIEREAKREG
ncbi:MAG: hypothetical protein KY468_04315 [Armatimonadetes bacterium]|nr:hypothetical protein [Armatimonadota bacterium]